MLTKLHQTSQLQLNGSIVLTKPSTLDMYSYYNLIHIYMYISSINTGNIKYWRLFSIRD